MQKRRFLKSLPLSFKPPTETLEHTDAYGHIHCTNCILLKTHSKLGEISNEKHRKIPKMRYTNRTKLPLGDYEPEILKQINQISDEITLSISYLSLFQKQLILALRKYLRVRNSFGVALMFLTIKIWIHMSIHNNFNMLICLHYNN